MCTYLLFDPFNMVQERFIYVFIKKEDLENDYYIFFLKEKRKAIKPCEPGELNNVLISQRFLVSYLKSMDIHSHSNAVHAFLSDQRKYIYLHISDSTLSEDSFSICIGASSEMCPVYSVHCC